MYYHLLVFVSIFVSIFAFLYLSANGQDFSFYYCFIVYVATYVPNHI